MELRNSSASNNGSQSGRNEENYDKKYDDDAQKVDMQLRKHEPDSEDVIQDLAAAVKNLWDVKGEKHGDVLEASTMMLCSAQDALETEVHKLKDVGKNGPFEELDPSETSNILKPNVVHPDLKTEVQSMSKAVQLNQIEIMEQQKKLASEQMDVMNRLEVAKTKTTELKKQSEKLKATSEEISNKEEVWLARNSVGKLTSLFGIQLLLLGLVLYLFLLQLISSHEKEVTAACT